MKAAAVLTTTRSRGEVWTAATLSLCLSACTPTVYHLQPYASDEMQAAELAVRAEQQCREQRQSESRPPAAFTTDGCSMWPNGSWVACCVEHDIPYWCGGAAADRKHADRELKRCVADNGPRGMGTLMYWGLRLGGQPWLPFPWRWGYGWDWFRGYEDRPEDR